MITTESAKQTDKITHMKLHIGTPNAEGDTHYNANVLNDEDGNGIAEVYGFPLNATLEEIQAMDAKKPWGDRTKVALQKARHIVRCVNNFEAVRFALERMVRELPSRRDWLDPDTEKSARAAIAAATEGQA